MAQRDLRSANRRQPDGTPRRAQTAASLAFWLCLFACTAVYALVLLSPKLIKNIELTRIERKSQWQLLELQRRIDYLDRVARAYEFDPDFRREKARSEFQVHEPGEQPIPIPRHLTLQIGANSEGRPLPQNFESVPIWYEPWMRALVARPGLGTLLLVNAAVFLLGAFTFLHPTVNPPPASRRAGQSPVRQAFRGGADSGN